MKLFKIFLFSLLLIVIHQYQFIYPQVTLSESFRFELSNPTQSIVNVQVIDVNNDLNEEVIVFMKDSISWNIGIYDTSSLLEYNEWSIQNNEELAKVNIFKHNNILYIASVLKNSSYGVVLKVYRLSDFVLIYEVEKPPTSHYYIIEWDINSLCVETISDTSIVYIGYRTNEYYDGPGVYVYEDNAYMFVFSFEGTLNFITTIYEIDDICIANRLGYGRHGFSVSGASSGSGSTAHIKKIDYVNGSIYIEEIFELINDNSSSAFYNFAKITSCDYSDTLYGSVFAYDLLGSNYGFKNYFCLSADFETILWENNYTYCNRFYKIIASSNFKVNEKKNHIIYFDNNGRMEIRNRLNGEIVHSDWITINPISIFENVDSVNVYLCREGDELVGYVANDINFIINDINSLDDNLYSFILSQNYPNPFNPSTSIQYTVSSRQFVTLKVYDVLGNEIATLVNKEKPAGSYEVAFNGLGLTSGIYFYRLIAGNDIETKKMVLLK